MERTLPETLNHVVTMTPSGSTIVPVHQALTGRFEKTLEDVPMKRSNLRRSGSTKGSFSTAEGSRSTLIATTAGAARFPARS